MIFSIRNRYLRGLAVWGLVLGFVLAFPFIVLAGGAVDAWNNVRASWRDAKDERRAAWRLMTFRSVE
jgi:hypothetical protein